MNPSSLTSRRLCGSVLAFVAVAVIGSAGLLKLSNLEAFFADLSTWTLVPEALVPPIALGVAVLEVCVLGLWIVPSLRRTAAIVAAGVLVLFAVAYRAQVAFSPPAGCACFGAFTPDFFKADSADALLFRNGAIAVCAVVGWWLLRPAPGATSRAKTTAVRKQTNDSGRGSVPGFTLIEIVVVIAIVTVLIALSMPLLNDIRTRGRFTSTIANSRSHATILNLYATDHKDTWPYVTDPRVARSTIRYDHGASSTDIGYFQASEYWGVALADAYFGGRWAHPSFRSALQPLIEARGNDYVFPCAFIARPEYFNPETRSAPPEQLAPTRVADVLYPAEKALVVDAESTKIAPIRGVSWRVFATVDTSAGRWKLEQLNRGMRSGDGPQAFNERLGGHWPGDPFDLLHTIDGVRGRDIAR